MSGDRRQVRVSQTLFDRLDELFAEERSAEGAPSATDFLLHEIPAIIDVLQTRSVNRRLRSSPAPTSGFS